MATHEPLLPPKMIPAYRFLCTSAHKHTKMPCGCPQVIDHMAASKRIGPAGIRAVDGQPCQWYR